MKKTLRLQTKITIMITVVVFASIVIILPFMTNSITSNVQKKVEINIINVAKLISKSKTVREELIKEDPDKIIQPYINMMLKASDNIEFIVVADMDGIRYSHPNPRRVGQRFVGGDQNKVIENGETYISEATGTLGKSLRSFTPIYDLDNKKQIGFVSVGTLSEGIERAKKEAFLNLIILACTGILVGIFGAFLLANNIKNTLLGLEPSEITKLYNEKLGMLDAIHEGIIAIDENGRITLINDSALNILQIKDKHNIENLIGIYITDIFYTSRLIKVLKTGIAEYDKEQRVNDTIIVTNRVPIMSNEKIVGAIATFRDKTKITRLAEEVTGVKLIVESLRANTHEFLNKLHVILGLLHIGEIEDAKKYIVNVTERQQQILSMIIKRIKDATVAGLILGKFSRAKELGIKIEVDEATNLNCNHKNISSNALITIIGNVLENAFEAVSRINKDEKIVSLRIEEMKDRIEIEIGDNGIGIEEINLEQIYQRGYTTKAESQGVGLDTVKKTVEMLNGEINVSSYLNKGTTFKIILPKEG
ncbi:DcuS/MalK family sensor histidine kinase [Wukongibacter sp. M2B1]|uniref:DcuS/MalK family sensor histidine kinase n=1 Tax=Wukongibacter sp. M2B1 TaxID=3088895 RepID=UPI003D7B9F21